MIKKATLIYSKGEIEIEFESFPYLTTETEQKLCIDSKKWCKVPVIKDKESWSPFYFKINSQTSTTSFKIQNMEECILKHDGVELILIPEIVEPFMFDVYKMRVSDLKLL